jgi:hypothetical protein
MLSTKWDGRILLVAMFIAVVAAGNIMADPVYPDFAVNEGSVLGSNFGIFVADKITGNYVAVISFTSVNTFAISLKWQAGQFVANDGTTPLLTSLNAPTNGYKLYAVYQGAGTFSTNGSGVTTFTLTAGIGSLSHYIDPNSDTTLTAPADGTLPWMRGNDGDDYAIATGYPLDGTGTFLSLPPCGANGINCGSFGMRNSFVLNPNGQQFFVMPVPFYSLSFQSGQFNNFAAVSTQIINGSMDVIFAGTAGPPPSPAQEAVELLTDEVEALLESGALTQNQADGLTNKLEAAISSLEAGATRAACNQIQAFINQISGFIKARKLSSGEGQVLINAAQRIRTKIGC